MQKMELAAQRDKISRQKKNVTDSILYAQRIQLAILPTDQYINELVPDNLIIYMPRDIVSGDFYFIRQKFGKVYLAVADSTGHGVPGALMSMLGYAFLNEIINNVEVETNPAEILDRLRLQLVNALKQKGEVGETHNGMDISVLVINTHTQTYQFAGANNPLYVIKPTPEKIEDHDLFLSQIFTTPLIPEKTRLTFTDNNSHLLVEVKGDKMPIGPQGKEDHPFLFCEAKIEAGDTLFLITDGFASQFGGPNGRKYQSKKLRKFLVSIQNETMERQKEIILENFRSWRGRNSQVDDITLLGLRF
jgi:serine phosphatase RsbU (regulator of sigma subunit)